MASSGQGVLVLAPNGRRQTVKVKGGTLLQQVLEEVCRKQNLNPRDYGLKFQRTLVDLTLQWRFANIPNNAKLEMVSCTQQQASAQDTKVRVALQLENGERFQGEFLCSQSLMDILLQFPETREQLAKVVSGYTPVCIYMRDEVTGELALKQTTLQSLGLTKGSAIIRFVVRKCDQSVNQECSKGHRDLKMETHPVCKKECSFATQETSRDLAICEEKKSSCKGPAGSEAIVETPAQSHVNSNVPVAGPSSAFSKQEEKQTSERNIHPSVTKFIPFQGGGHCLGGASLHAGPSEDGVPSSSAQKSFQSPGPSKPKKSKTERECNTQPVDRQPLVCHMDLEENTAHESRELPEDFFEITVDDVRRRFAELRSERQRLEEAPLVCKASRDRQEQEKLERYSKVVLRVLFPDRYVLQGFFHPTETVGAVKEFVCSHLEDSNMQFYLFITPPRTELKDDSQTLFQEPDILPGVDLFPAALVHFGSQMTRDHYLSQQLLKAPMSPSQADIAVARAMPRVSSTSESPALEDFAGLTAGENLKTENAIERNEESNVEPQQSAQRDLGKVPKWLKLPGKK
uniref:Alveolar soft part sarcoma chromosome region, candidate 1 n=1 Tax=Xenopus tropicalis TaxID=8364 RepID=A0A6I8Q5Y3_XENTR